MKSLIAKIDELSQENAGKDRVRISNYNIWLGG